MKFMTTTLDASTPITADSLAELVTLFNTGTLSYERWTHHAHMLVALWYLWHFPFEEASERIRTGIIKYNGAVGVPHTPTRGYHETITRFYIWVIGEFLKSCGPETTLEMAAKLMLERLGERELPLRFYSRDRLFSWEARLTLVSPDLHPLELD